jgi:hypothetical protein
MEHRSEQAARLVSVLDNKMRPVASLRLRAPAASAQAPVGGRWLALSLGVVGLVAGLAVALLGVIFVAAMLEPIGPGEEIGRGVGTGLILTSMTLSVPLALGAGVGSLVVGDPRAKWLPRLALGLTSAGVACVVVPFGWVAIHG